MIRTQLRNDESGEFREMPEAMPGLLARVDDPWGITWRVRSQIRRSSVRRGVRFLSGYARGVRHERPIFILGAPRSGTTMLFYLLRESGALASLPGEGHDIWRALHHPRYGRWRSDAVGAGDARVGERRFVASRFYSHFGAGRFVEKTPENSLRVPYLLELFPDAIFVEVRRDPCDVINSIINGWRHPAGRFRTYYVPEDLHIPGYPHRRRWCFALIEGWRDFKASPIPEIAFEQWNQCTRALERARELVPPSRWIDVSFEEFLAEPSESLARICAGVDIQVEPALERKLDELVAVPVNALSGPRSSKWRTENADEIRPLLPRIAAAAPARGYRVDEQTGEFELTRRAVAAAV